jgi:ATP-binding cassette subfamily C protein
LPALLTGYATARAVDSGFLAGRPLTGLAWLSLIAAAVLPGAVAARRTFVLIGELVEPFRDEVLRRVVVDALHGTGAARPGRGLDTGAVARLTQQVEIVRDTYAGLLAVVRGFLFASVAAVAGLLALDPVVAAVVAVPLVVALLLFALALPAMVGRQRTYVLAGERLGAAASLAFAGHRDVTACGAADRAAAGVGRHIDAQARAERGLAGMAAARSLILAVGGWLPLIVLLLCAPWLIRRGVSAGALLGALVYVTHGLQPALHTLVRGVAAGGLRFAVTLDRILCAAAPPPPPVAGASPDGFRLCVRRLQFRYGQSAAPVVDGLDLDLPEGAHLAIVGPSGVGKSTLAALLGGTLAADDGEVRIGGAPVRRLDPVHRVLIPQEAYVFTGTLRENLVYLVPAADDAVLERAIDELGARRLAGRLGGLDAPLDPHTLSAGQRQLIALVRAYVTPARVSILDEATCHLDPATEARVERAYARRPGTLVVVAHRISSALRAGQVLLLDGSGAVLGPHAELLDRSPLYRELVDRWASDPAGVLGGADRLDARPRSGLHRDPREVVAHRAGGDAQARGDLAHRQALRGQVEHVTLARGERAGLVEGRDDQVGVDDPLAPGEPADRVDH